MSATIRTIHPLEEPSLSGLLEAAFERPDRESRFVELLAEHHPNFDPGLSLLAEVDGQPAGYTLFLPREITIRGVKVSLAVATPLGVLPQFREQGVGRMLTMTGLTALADRGMRGAITMLLTVSRSSDSSHIWPRPRSGAAAETKHKFE